MTTPMTAAELTPEMRESIDRHNRMMTRANARLRELWDAGIHAGGELRGQGVTITIERVVGFGGAVARSHEIIPY